MPYDILDAAAVDSRVADTPGAIYPKGCYPGYQQGARKYPRPDWPMNALDVGQGFEIPIADGRDLHGRSIKYIQALVWQGNQLGLWGLERRFKVTRLPQRVLVSRVS